MNSENRCISPSSQVSRNCRLYLVRQFYNLLKNVRKRFVGQVLENAWQRLVRYLHPVRSKCSIRNPVPRFAFASTLQVVSPRAVAVALAVIVAVVAVAVVASAVTEVVAVVAVVEAAEEAEAAPEEAAGEVVEVAAVLGAGECSCLRGLNSYIALASKCWRS